MCIYIYIYIYMYIYIYIIHISYSWFYSPVRKYLYFPSRQFAPVFSIILTALVAYIKLKTAKLLRKCKNRVSAQNQKAKDCMPCILLWGPPAHFWVCLWGCFWKRLAFESVKKVRKSNLTNVFQSVESPNKTKKAKEGPIPPLSCWPGMSISSCP